MQTVALRYATHELQAVLLNIRSLINSIKTEKFINPPQSQSWATCSWQSCKIQLIRGDVKI